MPKKKGKRRRPKTKLTHVRSKKGEHFFLTEGEVVRLRRVARKRFHRWEKQPGAIGFQIRKK